MVIDNYEEVLDFKEKLKDIIYDIPDFDGCFNCEDCLTDALKICADWLEENQEKYLNERRLEEQEMNIEFEKQRRC